MTAERKNGDSAWVDPDDAPELDALFFASAEVKQGEAVISQGRPNLDNPNKQTLRSSVSKFKPDPL